MNEAITHISLDVHKDTIAVALADGRGCGEVRSFGQIVNTLVALSRLLTKLVQLRRALSFAMKQVLAAVAFSDS